MSLHTDIEGEIFDPTKIARDVFERQNRFYYPVGIPRSKEMKTQTDPILKKLKVPTDFRQRSNGNDTSRWFDWLLC